MTRKQQIKSIKYIYTLLDGLNKNDLSELTHQNIKFRKYFDKFYGEKVKNNLIREIENLATLRMNVRSFNSATEYTKYAVVALKHEALKDKIVIKTIECLREATQSSKESMGDRKRCAENLQFILRALDVKLSGKKEIYTRPNSFILLAQFEEEKVRLSSFKGRNFRNTDLKNKEKLVFLKKTYPHSDNVSRWVKLNKTQIVHAVLAERFKISTGTFKDWLWHARKDVKFLRTVRSKFPV